MRLGGSGEDEVDEVVVVIMVHQYSITDIVSYFFWLAGGGRTGDRLRYDVSISTSVALFCW